MPEEQKPRCEIIGHNFERLEDGSLSCTDCHTVIPASLTKQIIREALEVRFPWLGTTTPPWGADIVKELTELYIEVGGVVQ